MIYLNGIIIQIPSFLTIWVILFRYIEPTILLNPPTEAAIMVDEIFGPLLPIITARSGHSRFQFELLINVGLAV